MKKTTKAEAGSLMGFVYLVQDKWNDAINYLSSPGIDWDLKAVAWLDTAWPWLQETSTLILASLAGLTLFDAWRNKGGQAWTSGTGQLSESPPVRHRVSSRGLAMLKRFEDLRLESYLDDAGVWTIGYGHTSQAGPPTVKKGMTISPQEALALFRNDLGQYEEAVASGLENEIDTYQFDAFVSLAYNIGTDEFLKSTTLRRFNEGDIEGAAEALTWFKKVKGQVNRGLVKRRTVEKRYFLGATDFKAHLAELERDMFEGEHDSTLNIARA